MQRFDPASAEVLVFTFKEGLLSAIAHDLKLRVTGFEIRVADEAELEAGAGAPAVEARFDPGSLRVVTAMRDGQEAPSLLSEKDHREIEANIVKEVLEARRYPEVRFRADRVERAGSGAGVLRLAGVLALHGRERPLVVEARETPGAYEAEVALSQPDFGIRPYSAMLGTLKVRPEVRVRVRLPRTGGGA